MNGYQPLSAEGLDLGRRADRDRYRSRVAASVARMPAMKLVERARAAGALVSPMSPRALVVRSLADAWIIRLQKEPNRGPTSTNPATRQAEG